MGGIGGMPSDVVSDGRVGRREEDRGMGGRAKEVEYEQKEKYCRRGGSKRRTNRSKDRRNKNTKKWLKIKE